MRFGWRQADADEELPTPDDTVYDGTEATGWTGRLEVTAPTNGFSNGYLVPARGGAPAGGFLTRPRGEEYYYVVEMTPTRDEENDTQSGPRMSPVLDDVVVLYAPWAAARVLAEAEVMGE